MARHTARETRKESTKQLDAIAAAFGNLKQAREELVEVVSVPTDFVQFDHATRIGGIPSDRIVLVHGPSSGGKTAFALGLVKSYLRREHGAFFIDAERTTDGEWVGHVFGTEKKKLFDSPLFRAKRPDNYEDAMDSVREYATAFAALRESGHVAENARFLVVVDSLKKLIPKDHTKKLLKEGADGAGMDGMGGRSAMMQAAANTAWMNELVPLLEKTSGTVLLIARESEDPNADIWTKKAGRDFKITGGRSIYYDSSLVIRVERAGFVTHGDGKDRVVYGERHRVSIDRSKVAPKEGYNTICYFHSSNGNFLPVGLDRARDVLEITVKFGVITQAGAWFSYGKQKLGAGEHAAVKVLADPDGPDLLNRVEADVRARFAKVAPVEITEDGEVVE
jgi:recombination protein RecA